MTRFLLVTVATVFGALASLSAPLSAQERLHRLEGERGDRLGSDLITIEDLDGNGLRDFVASSPTARDRRGTVSAFSAENGSVLFEIVGPEWEEQPGPFEFGRMLSRAGDVDGDGVEDIIVGAPHHNNGDLRDSGMAIVYSGANQTILHQHFGQGELDLVGLTAAAMGDLNGDGLADYALGVVGKKAGGLFGAGAVHVYSGSGGLLYQVEGSFENDLFGRELTSLTDVDGDGRRDLAICASGGSDQPSRLEVISGATAQRLYAVTSNVEHEKIGSAVAEVADLDGDQVRDILIGVTEHAGASYALLLSGASGNMFFRFSGKAPYDHFGSEVRGLGDVNGDGVEDLLISASQWDSRNTGIGYARLYSGATRALLYEFSGEEFFDVFGSALIACDDLDGDGLAEFAISARNASSDRANRPGAGRVDVFLGNDLYLHIPDRTVSEGDVLLLTVGEGEPSHPILLSVASVEGMPTFLPAVVDYLDSRGRWTLVARVPGGIGDLDIELQAYTRSGGEKIISSAPERLSFR